MGIIKRNLILTTLMLFVTISGFSLASFEITPKINTMTPESTLMYFYMSNPEKLMESFDSFLSATGMGKLMGNMPMKDFFNMLLDSKDIGFSMDQFNFSNPAGLALIPSINKHGAEDNPEFMIFVPVNTYNDSPDLNVNKPEGSDYWYIAFRNYLIFFSSEELKNR